MPPFVPDSREACVRREGLFLNSRWETMLRRSDVKVLQPWRRWHEGIRLWETYALQLQRMVQLTI